MCESRWKCMGCMNYFDVTWVSWRLKLTKTPLFVQILFGLTAKNTSKLNITSPPEGKSTVDRQISSQLREALQCQDTDRDEIRSGQIWVRVHSTKAGDTRTIATIEWRRLLFVLDCSQITWENRLKTGRILDTTIVELHTNYGCIS